MLYEPDLKDAMLNVLVTRVLSIADCIQVLVNEGYVPNKYKQVILSWTSIMVDAYENIEVLTKEQQDKLDALYNRVLKL